MVFSILGLINFAHGELVTIGGYTMWTLFNHDVPWPAVLVLTLLATTVAAFALSGLLAGVAALLFFASAPGVDSGVGTPLVINAFIGVILGGLGNLYGAVLGGFVLGLATSLLDANLHGTYTQFSQAFALAIVVGILLLRPQGLVGRTAGLT